ncbi:MAG: glutamate racemase [Treponema sp.]|jgi:glutamate racemase|nr:glutamate racemase [Treponema sp.]
MDNRPVLFLDSGIGGIPYCRDFLKRNAQETVYYIADRENFPYGPRSKEEIASILISLTKELLNKISAKLVVIACNTASISALSPLRQKFPQLLFVGTVPAIKPAVSACKSGKIGVLGTERTIQDIRTLNLEDGSCEIFGVSAPELVEFVEKSIDSASENEKTDIIRKYIDIFREQGIDTLVLGCTHFLYLIEEFRREAEPEIKIFDSLEGITNRIEFLLNENDGALRAQKDCAHDRKFILTGTQPPGPSWTNRAKVSGFDLCLINEL